MGLWHLILDWTGSNNGYDALSTHVYNFVSGLGSDLGEYAIVGALLHSIWSAEKRHREHMKELRLLRGDGGGTINPKVSNKQLKE